MRVKLGIAVAILAMVLVSILVNPENSTSAENRKPSVDPIRSVRMELLGLKSSTVDQARKIILSVKGVRDVKFRPEKREAKVYFDVEKTNLKKLEEALRKAGFTPYIH